MEFNLNDKKWEITEATLHDAICVAGCLREADLLEIKACGDMSAAKAIISSMNGSLCSFTVRRDGWPVAVFGVARGSALSDEYICWMLASRDIEEEGSAYTFAKKSREVLRALARRYPVMVNNVGEWNKKTLRWLAWCGFEILPARRLGVHGEFLCPVVYRAKGE